MQDNDSDTVSTKHASALTGRDCHWRRADSVAYVRTTEGTRIANPGRRGAHRHTPLCAPLVGDVDLLSTTDNLEEARSKI